MINAIERLILWPREPGLAPRVIPFNPGRVNVISGYSRTGKSAVLGLVDFALLSSECSIPSLIRRAASHVGVRLLTDTGSLTVARPLPFTGGQSKEEEDQHVLFQEGTTADVLTLPRSSGTLNAVKDMLNALVNLPDLPFKAPEPGGKQGFDARPGFRDLAAFLFQPQSIVANANTLFYKADTFQHRERLRHILPLILGLTTADKLAAEYRLAALRTEQARLDARVKLQNDARSRLRDRLLTLFARLREVGVIADFESEPGDLSTSDLSRTILAATELFRTTGRLSPSSGTGEMATEIAEETRRHELLARELGESRRRLKLFERMATAAAEYEASQQVNSQFMQSFEWLRDNTPASVACPLCGTESDVISEHLAEMASLLSDVARLGRDAAQVRDNARKDLELQRARVLDLESRITDVRENLRLLEEPGNQNPQSFRAIGVLLGESDYMARQATTGGASEEDNRLREIEREMAQLRSRLSSDDKSERDRIFIGLQTRVTNYARLLEVERAEDGATIDVAELMVRVGQGDDGEYLPQIGSGANWMGYHVAAILGLHEQLLSAKRRSAVPPFVFFDQPSQVYFPADPLDESRDNVEKKISAAKDDDLLGVRRVFLAMTRAVELTKGRLQVIVTEHAGPRVWTGLPVDLIGDWHDGSTKLIPSSWIEE